MRKISFFWNPYPTCNGVFVPTFFTPQVHPTWEKKSLLDCVNPLPLKDVVGLDFLLNQGAPYQVSIVRQRIKVGIKPATIQILILIYLV